MPGRQRSPRKKQAFWITHPLPQCPSHRQLSVHGGPALAQRRRGPLAAPRPPPAPGQGHFLAGAQPLSFQERGDRSGETITISSLAVQMEARPKTPLSAPSSAAHLRLLSPWEGPPARSCQHRRAMPRASSLETGRAPRPEDGAWRVGSQLLLLLPPTPLPRPDSSLAGCGPWLCRHSPDLAALRHPEPSGPGRGWAGPGMPSPRGSLQARLAGTGWARLCPGTTHPCERCPVLGTAVEEWVPPWGPEHAAKPGVSAPPVLSTPATLSSSHKGHLSREGWPGRGQAFLEQTHGPGTLFSQPPYEGKLMQSLSSTRSSERASALLEVTPLIRDTGRDPFSVHPPSNDFPAPYTCSPRLPSPSLVSTSVREQNKSGPRQPGLRQITRSSFYCPWNPSP